MCGEKFYELEQAAGVTGSPPHVRGKGYADCTEKLRLRITPACAGKSTITAISRALNEDHPRMCGEKMCNVMQKDKSTGSPPHVRGKERFCEGTLVDRWDHPRMCGEKTNSAVLPNAVQGSPPHVRGKVSCFHNNFSSNGITPACAGKRLKRSRSTVPHAAIVPLFPSVCNKPAGSDGSPAGHDAPPFLPIENAAPASPAYNLRSL